MKVIEQSHQIFTQEASLAEQLERCGRTAYESLDKIKEGSADAFVRGMVIKGHLPVLDLACVHINMELDERCLQALKIYNLEVKEEYKYIFLDYIGKNLSQFTYILSGSPRALTAYVNAMTKIHSKSVALLSLINQISATLINIDPACFSGVKLYSQEASIPIFIEELTEIQLDTAHEQGAISDDIYMRHKCIGVSLSLIHI